MNSIRGMTMMHRTLGIVLAFSLCMLRSNGQSEAAPASPAPQEPQRVQVFEPGTDVTSPELLPFTIPFTPPEKCKKNVDGKVVLALIVDASGKPRNVMFSHPLANDLDRFALQIAGADRFKPGIHDGVPVAVGQSLEIAIQSCVEDIEDSAGGKSSRLHMRTLPEQKLGVPAHSQHEAVLSSSTLPWKNPGSVVSLKEPHPKTTPPVAINTVTAQFTDEARKTHLNGTCLITLIVDPQGMPEDIRLIKGVDPGLDRNALIAAGQYRFKPALRDGEPIPVQISVEINFRMN
jgi:TonB family protein